jgi:predicted SPOUT superfamily RNA methylase MTH1
METKKPQPYYGFEIEILKGSKKIAEAIFNHKKSVQECIAKCTSPNGIIKLKSLQLKGENRKEDDCLSGELTVNVWETAGDSVGHECFRKLLKSFKI